MRLVRLAQKPSRVADDIRAALASLGRGNTVIGGVAVVGVQPPGCPRAVDAVVLLPKALLIVVGVDLPDPAMKLEAPLADQWKADGWPLVGTDEASNPAVEALSRAASVATHLRSVGELPVPVGTVIAVGPYVETVEQPPADLAGPVRVLHPTPTSMLAATVSLASAAEPCSVATARTLLAALAPETARLDDEVLAGEGFEPAPEPVEEADPLVALAPTVPAEPPTQPMRHPKGRPTGAVRRAAPSATLPPLSKVTPVPPPAPAPAPPPRPAAAPRQPVRWLPMAAMGLLLALLVTAVVMAATGDSGEQPPAQAAPPPVPSGPQVDGVSFVERAAGTVPTCAPHAFGDTQAMLERTPCTALRRASYEATLDGRRAAVSMAVVEFGVAAQAGTFKQLVDGPGNGGIADLATETGRWPGQPPAFLGASYQSMASQTTIRTVQACWLDGPSTPADPALTRIARAALSLPTPGP
ncbi:hypothetical protein [Amycolatopsis suaedae]|uniref:Uncharacterized protein n=1 Tax=Amycolatopsis suaedae TaxID=2510978 RepID=A0A4Q7JDZ5_9PSEU|nr:hypothetical protein [Amycolatopsis suaedae]RZQ64873.1 hypothetical protein EWH70_08315 [Amycolatopsis suaedae]